MIWWFVSVASMILGALAAIAQTNIKRLMAYSSIGHIGYALMGLVAGNEEGLRSVLIYLAIYLIMNVGVFACILSMKVQDRMVEGIGDLAGLGKTASGDGAAADGVHVLDGGNSAFGRASSGSSRCSCAAIESGTLITLAVIGVLTSVVSAFYYLRIIKVMYFDEPVEALDRVEAPGLKGVMAVSGILTAFLFIYLPGITDPATVAAKSLFGG